MWPFRKRRSPEQQFWTWFVDNEARLFDFERDQDRVLSDLGSALHAVDADLTFEIGADRDGRRELVLSAGGMKRAFPIVHRLADAAPSLPRWTLTRFRPRLELTDAFVLELGGIRMSSDNLRCQIAPASAGRAAIRVQIPGYVETDDRYGNIGFIMLDSLLGEYDVAMKIAGIEFAPFDALTDGPQSLGTFPMTQLPRHFDQMLMDVASKN